MKRSFAFLSILAASILPVHASPAPGAEDSMTQLQSEMARRANVLAMSNGMSRASHDGSKAVAGNTGSSGKAPEGRVAESRSASRDVGRSGAGSSLNERALNPQPLPPVETGRRPAAAGKDKALTTGIIIVGGKNGVAR